MTAPTSATGTRILVTGGVRSGKSRHAESLLLPPALPEDTPVTYLACGPRRDDADWAERVAAHRARRPATWTTVEDPDAAAVLRDRRGPVLLDCVGTWLTATLDALHAWDAPAPQWRPALDEAVDELVAAAGDDGECEERGGRGGPPGHVVELDLHARKIRTDTNLLS